MCGKEDFGLRIWKDKAVISWDKKGWEEETEAGVVRSCFEHAEFEDSIRNPRSANLHKHPLHTYHESIGFVLKLDYIYQLHVIEIISSKH